MKCKLTVYAANLENWRMNKFESLVKKNIDTLEKKVEVLYLKIH